MNVASLPSDPRKEPNRAHPNPSHAFLVDVLPAVLMLILFSLPITLPAMRGFHTFDSLMNLWRAREHPGGNLLSAALLFFPPNRPVGALLNLAIYYLMGSEPVFYLVAGVLLYWFNLSLLYTLFRRLGAQPFIALLATALAAYHPTIHHVLYNFGAIYELLSMTFALSTLHFWLRFQRRPKEERFYWFSLLTFLAALDSKEIAVAIPPLLLIQQILFSRRQDWFSRGNLIRLAPFFALLLPYTLSKTIGPGAVGDDELYHLTVSSHLFENLAWYFTEIANYKLVFTPLWALLTTAAAIGIGLWGQNRLLLFGVAWGLFFLAPVLLLSRTWGLFLYVPMAGFSLAVAAGVYQLGAWLLSFFVRTPVRMRFAWLARLVLFTLVLARLSDSTSTGILRSRQIHYFDYNAPYDAAMRQLQESYPELPPGTVLAFNGFPIHYPHDRWIPTLLVWLKYNTSKIRVYLLPLDLDRFRDLDLGEQRDIHFLFWSEGKLHEQSRERFLAGLE